MLRAWFLVCAGEPESVPVTVKVVVVKLPVGVPSITPVVPCKARPEGNTPARTLQVMGSVPPLDCRVAVYGLPMVAFGSVFVVITNGAAVIVMLSAISGVCGGTLWSVARMLKFMFPDAVGVPEITPV